MSSLLFSLSFSSIVSFVKQLGQLPTFFAKSKINSTDWKVHPIPASLLQPGIEISGPSSQTAMMIKYETSNTKRNKHHTTPQYITCLFRL
jgi:hypothetical protein